MHDGIEFTTGAYTVANLNDTDGDGRIDNIDPIVVPVRTQQVGSGEAATSRIDVASVAGITVGDSIVIVGQDEEDEEIVNHRTIQALNVPQGHIYLTEPLTHDFVDAEVRHAGRKEVDLMKLVVHRPDPDDQGGFVTLSAGGAVAFWEESWKETQFTTMMIPVDEFPVGGLFLWVEATAASGALRDIVIQLEYQGVKDVVSATGIWSTVTAVAHDLRTAADLFADPEWSDIAGPVRDTLEILAHVGLRPPGAPLWIVNLIAIQFEITPYRDPAIHGTWESDGVRFDVTRQVDHLIWLRTNAGDEMRLILADRFPANVELPNDDTHNDDESDVVTERGRFYSMDGPGTTGPATGGAHEQLWQFNANEWLRVRVDGDRPAAEAVSGSRVSSIYPWHVAHRWVDDGTGKWKRTTGDAAEVALVNDVAPLHVQWTVPE